MGDRAVGVSDVAPGAAVTDYHVSERSVVIPGATLLGRRTVGSTTADFNAASNTALWRFQAINSGSLAVIKAHFKRHNPALSAVKLGIYSDNAGAPDALLGVANVDNLAAAQTSWPFQATLATPVSITSGTFYWLGWRGVGEQVDWLGDASGSYLELTTDFPATWSGGNPGTVNAAIWGEAAAASTVGKQYLVLAPERVFSGVYYANTGNSFITAAAHAATAGYWFLINPVGSTRNVGLRYLAFSSALVASSLQVASGPRFTLERFTFTGTASGASITPAKRKGADLTATAKLLTASTGLTITSGDLIKASLPAMGMSNSPAGTSRQTAPSYTRDYPAGRQYPTWGDPGTIILTAGEGLIFRQADAGSTSEATHRTITTDIVWEEYTLP